MGEHTGISWTDHTLNWWWICTEVADGCDNCYARELAKILRGMDWGPGVPRIKTKSAPADLRKWNKKAMADGVMRKVFAHSMSDIFDVEAQDVWRVEEFAAWHQTTNLWFQTLTKRASLAQRWDTVYPADKVWLGTSVASDKDLPLVRQIVRARAKLHWVSYEPAIGPLSIAELPDEICWLVIGGESKWRGKCRPFDINWAYNAIEDCHKRGIKVFVKQMGSNPFCSPRTHQGTGFNISLKDHHGADQSEWPIDLRIQEFPV